MEQIVMGILDRKEVYLNIGRIEGCSKVLGLLEGNCFVQRSMYNLKWWCIRAYVRDGTSKEHQFFILGDGTTEELRDGRWSVIDHQAACAQEIVRSRPSYYCLDMCGIPRRSTGTFKRGHISSDAEQGREMTTSG